MKKYTYNLFCGNYTEFMRAYNKLSNIDTMYICTDEYIDNYSASVHRLYNINDISQYFNIDIDTICFIYSRNNNKLFIMYKSVYTHAVYMLCDNAFQYYYFTPFEYTNIDTLLYSNIDFYFNNIDNITLDKLNKAYAIGSQIAGALTDLCLFNKLGNYSINQISLHNDNYDTQALFEQVTIMLNNVILYGKLI